MIYAVIILSIALLAACMYATMLHTRLQHAEKESERLQTYDNRFREMAAQVLNDSQRSLSQDNSRQMEEILKPLRQNIENFNRTIDEKYSREASERGALREKIDELHRLNVSLGQEAKQLSDALRGNGKVQGDWGEMVLARLLEQAGFTEGREFDVQKNFKDPNGGADRRPDVVVYFPDQGCVVIDSKTSLTAYVNLCAATDESTRQTAANAHVMSVRTHMRELAAKNYQDFVGNDRKLDFVFMFIPNEGAYLAAMQTAPELWQEAYDKKVMIISPTHLFSVLKLVQQLWNHDAQTRNAIAIATEAGKMYDKFVNFTEDMEKIGQRINQAADAHTAAMKKLQTGTGNLINRAESLRALGAKTAKTLTLKSDTTDE